MATDGNNSRWSLVVRRLGAFHWFAQLCALDRIRRLGTVHRQHRFGRIGSLYRLLRVDRIGAVGPFVRRDHVAPNESFDHGVRPGRQRRGELSRDFCGRGASGQSVAGWGVVVEAWVPSNSHRPSMSPKCQMASATSQVTTKTPTMMKPGPVDVEVRP